MEVLESLGRPIPVWLAKRARDAASARTEARANGPDNSAHGGVNTVDSTTLGPTADEAMPSEVPNPPSNRESMRVSPGASCGMFDSTPSAADRWSPPGVDWWTPQAWHPAEVASEPSMDIFESLFSSCGEPDARPDDGPA